MACCTPAVVPPASGGIQKSALSIEGNCTTVTAAIGRSLDQAVAALAGVAGNEPGEDGVPSAA